MIIPVRCFTCNKIIGDKWHAYVDLVAKYNNELGKQNDLLDVEYLKKKEKNITAECKALDELGLSRYCCRRHMLTHVDLLEII